MDTYRNHSGVIGKLVKEEAQLRGEVVALITQKLRTSPDCKSRICQDTEKSSQPEEITKNQANRMQYKKFEDSITRKHGVLIEGWPLKVFENPSSIGSHVELKVLLNSWQSGATRFRKMSVAEHMAWVENRREVSPDPSTDRQEQTSEERTLPTNPTSTHGMSIIQFESSATTPAVAISNDTTPMPAPKKPRKTRSDRGGKNASQMPGVNVFAVA